MAMTAWLVWALCGAAANLQVGRAARQLRSALISTESGFAYDYAHHGQDWVQGTCASRQRQSPINIDDLASPPTGKLSYMYQTVKSSIEVANNGHAISADFAGLGYGGITYENAWYNLMNINVHAKSEHTWRTLHKPVELHLVHKKFDSDALLIVAIALDSSNPPPGFIQTSEHAYQNRTARKRQPPVAPSPSPVGDAFAAGDVYKPPPIGDPNFNNVVQMYLKTAPPPMNQKAVAPITEVEPIDLNKLFAGGTFSEYAGSLTAPPCAEIVTWFVRREPVLSSDLQVHYLHDALYRTTADLGNFRQVMPLNGRAIAVRQAVREEPPPRAPEMSIPIGPNPRTDREFRAMKWAKDALKISKAATDYVRDLDFRLRNAAMAHANALAPNLIPAVIPTAPPPSQLAPGGPSPQDMAKQAESMANVISKAAKEAIQDAAKQISIEAKSAAKAAAREATAMVKEGLPPPVTAQAPAR